MSSFICRCGKPMRDTSGIESHMMLLVPELSIEGCGNKLSKKLLTEEEYYDEIDKNAYEIINCTNCDRIWIAEEMGRGSKRYVSYISE